MESIKDASLVVSAGRTEDTRPVENTRPVEDVIPVEWTLAEAVEAIAARLGTLPKGPVPQLVAIDGRCGSGKSRLADALAAVADASVIRMDDFFLQPHQRTEARLCEVGGNVDRERFATEVLSPWREGRPFQYRRFDCGSGRLGPAIEIPLRQVWIVEGAYSHHPAFSHIQALRIFLTTDPAEQKERILRRNGPDLWKRFADEWIPMEERYFRECEIERKADLSIRLLTE